MASNGELAVLKMVTASMGRTMSDSFLVETARTAYPATSNAEPISTHRKNQERYLTTVCQRRMTVGAR